MSSNNIIVTGGAGYVGSHTCKLLHEAGYTPVVVDNLSRGHRWAVQWGPLEPADLLDQQHVEDILRQYRPQAVLHFAALAYVGESVSEPGLYYENNVVGSLRLLDAMRACGVDRIVFSSTCATYGEPQWLPLDETHPQAPINPYGASKLMVERLLADYAAAYDLRSVALRYFNAAGADPGGVIGELHEPETHLIPLILQVAAGERAALTIHGEDYDTPDGTCVRDYIHVCDLGSAHLRALESMKEQPGARAYNLGNGAGYSVREVVQSVERVTGQPVRCEAGPRRPGDPPRLVADANRARSELGWVPRLAALDAMVETAWAWWCAPRRHDSRGGGVGPA